MSHRSTLCTLCLPTSRPFSSGQSCGSTIASRIPLLEDESAADQPGSGASEALGRGAGDPSDTVVSDGDVWISEVCVIEYVCEAASQFEASLPEHREALEKSSIERVHTRPLDSTERSATKRSVLRSCEGARIEPVGDRSFATLRSERLTYTLRRAGELISV